MAKLILILGGARSGKSRFARQLAETLGGDDVLFVATAEAADAEMARRIEFHQRERRPQWRLLEIPRRLASTLDGAKSAPRAIVIDCLTLLVSNLLLEEEPQRDPEAAERRVSKEINDLLDLCNRRPGVVIIVSGEVGQGVVPNHPLGRQFRDLLGRANQTIAAVADAAYLLVAGLPIELKALAATVEQAARACAP